MAVLELRTMPDPVLRTPAARVGKVTDKTRTLIENMCTTMLEHEGLGLAAPQVGVLKQIIVFRNGEQVEVLINPEIEAREGSERGEEGCLSIPGQTGEVDRAWEIVIGAEDVEGRRVRMTAQGLLARILQHEIDHLEGVLFIDRAEEVEKVKG